MSEEEQLVFERVEKKRTFCDILHIPSDYLVGLLQQGSQKQKKKLTYGKYLFLILGAVIMSVAAITCFNIFVAIIGVLIASIGLYSCCFCVFMANSERRMGMTADMYTVTGLGTNYAEMHYQGEKKLGYGYVIFSAIFVLIFGFLYYVSFVTVCFGTSLFTNDYYE